MSRSAPIALRIFPAGPRPAAAERVASIARRLESRRAIRDAAGGWQVRYRADSVSEAMAMCAADLDDLDPGWMEALDFEAVRPFGRPGADAGRGVA